MIEIWEMLLIIKLCWLVVMVLGGGQVYTDHYVTELIVLDDRWFTVDGYVKIIVYLYKTTIYPSHETMPFTEWS